MKQFVIGIGVGAFLSILGGTHLLKGLSHPSQSLAQATAEPVLIFENERIKAWSLTLEPGQSTPQHTHQLDEIVVCLESSKLRITKPGPDSGGQSIQPEGGEVFMPKVKGVTHTLTNAGATRYKQISIELK
jgi:predicted metal-dependent enzyme (double-stranded beta helix superfamily)